MNQDTISAWEKVTRLSGGEGSFLRIKAHHQGRTNSKTGLIQHQLLPILGQDKAYSVPKWPLLRF